MAKYYGRIGYSVTTETSPGVWKPTIVERYYYGDVTRNMRREESAQQVNDDININNTISIVADDFAYGHSATMLYIEFMGSFWKISGIEVNYPRLILSIGGVYNGETASGTSADT